MSVSDDYENWRLGFQAGQAHALRSICQAQSLYFTGGFVLGAVASVAVALAVLT